MTAGVDFGIRIRVLPEPSIRARRLLAACLLVVSPPGPEASGAAGHDPSPMPSSMVVPWRGQRVIAEVRDGLAIVEGDIALGTVGQLEGRSKAGLAGPPTTKGHAFAYASQLWLPGNPGPVVKVPYTTSAGTAAVTNAIAQFNTVFAGVIQWVPRTNEADYVDFALTGNSSGVCYSLSVGRAGGGQTIGGSVACTVATLLHEMGHAIGLYHEHQRADAATRLTYYRLNVDRPNEYGNFGAPTSNADLIGFYDYGSIMHYGRQTLSKNNETTLETIPPGIPIGDAQTYSASDIDTVKRLYGFAPTSVVVTTHPAGLKVVVDGQQYTSPHSFAWALDSQHMLALPAGYQQLGNDADSKYQFANWNDGLAESHQITVSRGSGERTEPADRPAVTVYQASFMRHDRLDLVTSGNGAITIDPPPALIEGVPYVPDGSVVTATATPVAGNQFYQWYGIGAYPYGLNPKPWRVTQPLVQIGAEFVTQQTMYTVTASVSGPAPPTSPKSPTLYSDIDSGFAFLPQNFIAADGWSAGQSTHTVLVAAAQAPVTTNVEYDFVSWSDGGGLEHPLDALPPTSTTYTANYKPSYRGYSLNDPACATASPPVADAQYPDGTNVPFSVAPAPGWQFVGWTDALAGQPNPTNLTVHDQFAVVARFNTTGTPLSITSLSPSNTIVAGSNVPLQINGTGFTASSSVYVGDRFVASPTLTGSTRFDITLTAADLAVVGGINIQVRNTVLSCFTLVDATLDVRSDAGLVNGIFEDGFESP